MKTDFKNSFLFIYAVIQIYDIDKGVNNASSS